MKKILAFLSFLSLSLGAAAQDIPWQWNPDNSGAQDRTVVIADLVVNGLAVDIDGLDSHYLIGAFIDGECRGLSETVTNSGKRWLQIEVFGNYGHTDDSGKPISFRLYDKDSQSEYPLSSSRPVVWNQTTYGMPSADHVVLSAWTMPTDAVVTYPATITLSKLHDVQVTFTHTNSSEAALDPALLAVTIADGPHGWTAATVTGNGLQWTMRGLAVGEYDYYVTYDGKRMLTDDGKQAGKLIIPAEISLANGWDWISLYVPTPFSLIDPPSGFYMSTLNIDSQNQVIEIRSQEAAVYNDPQQGLFGDITELTAADGFYKIKSNYDEQHSANAIFNLGTSVDGQATAAMMPMVEPGYTWIGYPHEQNHSLEVLQDVLSSTATDGDRIIGHNAFLEYDGYQWVGSLRVFEAGKGYIYYTENTTPFRLNWGDYYMPQEPELLTSRTSPLPSPWHYDYHRYASSMPVVASLDLPLALSDGRYTVGAFVGNECRGLAEVTGDDHLFITLAGTPGEMMTFKLYDNQTGRTTALKEKLRYGTAAGNVHAPLQLHASTDGIEETEMRPANPHRRCYNLLGSPVTAGRAHGIYITTVSDGVSTKTIKMIK